MKTVKSLLNMMRGGRTRIVLASLIPFAAYGLQLGFWVVIKPYVWFLFFRRFFYPRGSAGYGAG